MEHKSVWIESKAKERSSQNFIKMLLELSDYKVMSFGIENHNQEIIKEIMTNYKPATNRKLLSMPDYVVVDEETKESSLVEVKYRQFKDDFDMKNGVILFRYGSMSSYLEYWTDAVLILIFNVKPYCLCVDFRKVQREKHFRYRFRSRNGKIIEAWNFCGIYKIINLRFPKVTSENFRKTEHLL